MNMPIETQTFATLLTDWMGDKNHPQDAIPNLAGVDTTALAHELMADIARVLNPPPPTMAALS